MNPVTSTRILVVSEHVLGNAGYVEELVAYLRDARGHVVDLEIATPSTRWRRLLASAQIPKVRFYDLDFSAARWHLAYSAEARARVDAALRTASYDSIFVHTQNAALRLADRMRDVPTIVSGDATNIQLADMGWNARGRFTRYTWQPSIRAERKAYDAARWVTKMSHWAADSVRRDYGVPDRKIVVAPPLLATAPAYPERVNERVRLLFVGNDFARKGGPEVVDVFLREFSETCELHVVSKARVTLPDHPHIHLHTDLTKTDDRLRQLYASADVFVFPTHIDLIPNVLREAMAMGLPAVTSPLAAIPEIVEDGKTGILVRPGDRDGLVAALRRLVASPALREDLGRAALAKAEALNAESVAGRALLFA